MLIFPEPSPDAGEAFLLSSDFYKIHGLTLAIHISCDHETCIVHKAIWSHDYTDAMSPDFSFPTVNDIMHLAQAAQWHVVLLHSQTDPIFLCPMHGASTQMRETPS